MAKFTLILFESLDNFPKSDQNFSFRVPPLELIAILGNDGNKSLLFIIHLQIGIRSGFVAGSS